MRLIGLRLPILAVLVLALSSVPSRAAKCFIWKPRTGFPR